MEAINNLLIDSTIKEIGKFYKPGVLRWTKENRHAEWKKLVDAERAINAAIAGNDIPGMKKSLSSYRGLILNLCKKFENSKAGGNQFIELSQSEVYGD